MMSRTKYVVFIDESCQLLGDDPLKYFADNLEERDKPIVIRLRYGPVLMNRSNSCLLPQNGQHSGLQDLSEDLGK